MKILEGESFICVNLYDESIRATAEASRIPGRENLWYFNRLVVEPFSERGKGYGKRLLDELLKIMQKHGSSLINEVSDYGSGDPSRLIEWYKTFGFYEIEPGVLRWDPIEKKKNPLITRDVSLAKELFVNLIKLHDDYYKHFIDDATFHWGINISNLYEKLVELNKDTKLDTITIDRDLLYRAFVELETLYRRTSACPTCGSVKHIELIKNVARSITKFVHLSVSRYWTFPQ